MAVACWIVVDVTVTSWVDVGVTVMVLCRGSDIGRSHDRSC